MYKRKLNFAAKFRKAGLIAASAICLFGGASLAIHTPAFGESGIVHLTASTKAKIIKITRAKPKTIRTDASFSEIVVGDPSVATVSPLTDRSFYVVGTSTGTTGIALYNNENELVGVLDVEVGPNTNQLNAALRSALPDSGVSATSTNGSVVLRGKAKNPTAAAKAQAIAEKYDEDLINTVKVDGSQQVKLEVRFLEAQRRSGKDLGRSILNSAVSYDYKLHARLQKSFGLISGGTAIEKYQFDSFLTGKQIGEGLPGYLSIASGAGNQMLLIGMATIVK